MSEAIPESVRQRHAGGETTTIGTPNEASPGLAASHLQSIPEPDRAKEAGAEAGLVVAVAVAGGIHHRHEALGTTFTGRREEERPVSKGFRTRTGIAVTTLHHPPNVAAALHHHRRGTAAKEQSVGGVAVLSGRHPGHGSRIPPAGLQTGHTHHDLPAPIERLRGVPPLIPTYLHLPAVVPGLPTHITGLPPNIVNDPSPPIKSPHPGVKSHLGDIHPGGIITEGIHRLWRVGIGHTRRLLRRI